MTSKPVIALGAGSWGTALALLLARNGHAVLLWGHDAARMARLAHERCNAEHLPEHPFPENLSIREDLVELAGEVECFVLAVPSHGLRAVLRAITPRLSSEALLAWATKGVEPGSGKLMSQVLDEVVGERYRGGVISGPTFAREVAQGLPTAMTVAARDLAHAETIAQWLRNERVRVYTSDDLVGVQVSGAVKNVMAIAAGISDGLGFGANARAALITRGLAELRRLGEAMGGRPETFMGLAGVGDLVLTCTDDLSRNRRLGLALGQGRSLAVALAELGQVAEGVVTAPELRALARRHRIEMPITEQVCRVLFDGLAPQAAVEALFQREARQE